MILEQRDINKCCMSIYHPACIWQEPLSSLVLAIFNQVSRVQALLLARAGAVYCLPAINISSLTIIVRRGNQGTRKM